MKNLQKIFFSILVLFSAEYAASGQNSVDSISYFEMKSSHSRLNSLSFNSNYENLNVNYSRCEWTVDPSINFIEGKITSYFISQSNLDSLTFDCSQYLIVDSVIFHSSSISFTRQTDLLVCNLSSTILNGNSDSISIFYHGAPVATGNGSFSQNDHAGVPVLWTLSEPFGAKDWWPCRQNSGDKIDSIDIFCKVPNGNKCASNGRLMSVDSLNGYSTFHWKSNYPIAPYLVAIAVTNYVEFSDSVVLSNSDTLEILNYVYPEQIAVTQPAFSVTSSLISFYDTLLLTYPFSKEKYGHAQFGWGGGMEHQTMSFVGSFGFELVAHELVHQWFGDQLTCKNWSDIWLHEGFATFFSGVAIQHFKPNEFYAWKYSALQDIVSKPNGSVYCTDTTDLNRIFDGRLSYRKAGYVLNMLRWKFGESLFSRAIKNYLGNNSIRFNYSTTDDLKNSFEFITGINLTDFFNEWVYGEGYPTYDLEWSRTNNSVDLKIFQQTSDASVSFFHIPLAIQIGNSNLDSIVVVEPTFSGQAFHFDLNFKPEFISIDPNIEIISGNNKVKEDLPPGSIDDQIAIYPNPTKANVDVFAKLNSLRLVSYSVLDCSGRLLFNRDFMADFASSIELSSLSNGLYLLEIQTDLGTVHKKIILQK